MNLHIAGVLLADLSERTRLLFAADTFSFEVWNFYRARRKYQREDELIGSDPSAGNFIQLTTLPSGPALQPSKRMIRQKSRKDAEPIVESYLTIELRTASGTAMRIQGNMTSSHLRELISASNVQP